MKIYFAFVKKELLEGVKSYRSLILLIVFVILGMISPLFAKFLPRILESSMPEGVNVNIPEPSAIDSWTQFFSNIEQMGIIVLIIVFSGIVSREISKGTLVNLLTKGLSRPVVVLAKYTNIILTWTVLLLISFGVTYGYTKWFFEEESLANLGISVFYLWIFATMLFAMLLLGSTLGNKSYWGLLLVGIAFVIMMILNMMKILENINPLSLATRNVEVIQSATLYEDLIGNFIFTLVIMVVSIVTTVILFNRRTI